MQDTKQQVIATIIAVIVILLFLGIVFILMLVYYRNRKKQMAQEKEHLEFAFNQQLILAQTEVQEATLASLSKELHDNIGQLLGTAKILLGVAQRNPATQAATLATAGDTLGTAIQELRTISKTLNKEWLEQFSFFDNLQTEIMRINASRKHRVELNNTAQQVPYGAQQQLMLFRIVQEAVNNACRHGEAAVVTIHTTMQNSNFVVTISDNGKGFNVNEKSNGIGLANMKHRSALLGGQFKVSSGSGGTEVQVVLPTE